MRLSSMKVFETSVEMEFVINGVTCGSGFLTVRDGKLSTEDAEEEFFKTLRKNEKSLIEEAQEEERSNIVDGLTPEQESKLKEEHAKDYHGTDDDMTDAFEGWFEELSVEEIKTILA